MWLRSRTDASTLHATAVQDNPGMIVRLLFRGQIYPDSRVWDGLAPSGASLLACPSPSSFQVPPVLLSRIFANNGSAYSPGSAEGYPYGASSHFHKSRYVSPDYSPNEPAEIHSCFGQEWNRASSPRKGIQKNHINAFSPIVQ